MFCGYACVVYAMRGEYETAAPFIGFAIVLDMLDGRIARLTGTASDSASSSIRWPTSSRSAWRRRFCRSRGAWRRSAGWAGRPGSCSSAPPPCGWRASTFRARRAATSATSSACRVRRPRRCRRRRSSRIRTGCSTIAHGAARRSRWCIVPALLMVSTIRFRSFKTIDLQVRRPYSVLFLIAASLMLIVTHTQLVLVGLAYAYLASAFIGMAMSRIRHRGATRSVRSAERSRHRWPNAAATPADRRRATAPLAERRFRTHDTVCRSAVRPAASSSPSCPRRVRSPR